MSQKMQTLHYLSFYKCFAFEPGKTGTKWNYETLSQSKISYFFAFRLHFPPNLNAFFNLSAFFLLALYHNSAHALHIFPVLHMFPSQFSFLFLSSSFFFFFFTPAQPLKATGFSHLLNTHGHTVRGRSGWEMSLFHKATSLLHHPEHHICRSAVLSLLLLLLMLLF